MAELELEEVAERGEQPPASAVAAAGGRLVASAGFIPAGMTRRERRRQAKAVRQAELAARRAITAERATAMEADRQARRQAGLLPEHGESGPKALWSPSRLRIEPHRATSEVLSVAYPFLAEAGLGSEGLLIGHDSWSGAAFCYDPWALYRQGLITNPNMLLAGVIGRGKSALAKSLATRSVAFGRRVYVPGDPKGEWTIVSRTVGGVAIVLGGGSSNRLNPLDEGPRPAWKVNDDGTRSPMTDREWEALVRDRRRGLLGALAQQAMSRRLESVEATALFAALDTAVTDHDVPLLPHVVDAMFDPPRPVAGSTTEQLAVDGRLVAHALNRLVRGDLAGLFDGPSTVAFDPEAPMVSLDLSRISGSDELIALVMTCASAWMEAALTDSDGGQRWVVYDEAWRLMRQPALLARMQSQWKLSRALGIANLMVIHRLSDLDAVGEANSEARNLALGLLADCSTRILYAQERGEADKTGAAIGLSATEVAQLPGLDRGEGLWRIGDRAFVVRHTLTAAELAVFDTNSRMRANPTVHPD